MDTPNRNPFEEAEVEYLPPSSALGVSGSGQGVNTSPSVTASPAITHGRVVDRVTTFREAAQRIPLNEYGLPKYLYRADLIPEELPSYPAEEQIPILNAATIDLTYREGFPTYYSGLAMWSPMPYEPEESYSAFVAYLGLAERYGVRSLEVLAGPTLLQDLSHTQGDHWDTGVDTSPSVNRSQPTTALRGEGDGSPAHGVGLTLDQLLDFHTYYFWSARAKAYDLFQLVAHKKLRERRILSTTNAHFLEAEKLLGRVYDYFHEIDPETGKPIWVEELTPKVAMEMMEKLVKIQRVSIGLPAHGLANGEQEGTGGVTPGANVEVAFRQVARAGQDPESARQSSQGASIEMLLSDPAAAELAQELIIRVGKATG